MHAHEDILPVHKTLQRSVWIVPCDLRALEWPSCSGDSLLTLVQRRPAGLNGPTSLTWDTHPATAHRPRSPAQLSPGPPALPYAVGSFSPGRAPRIYAVVCHQIPCLRYPGLPYRYAALPAVFGPSGTAPRCWRSCRPGGYSWVPAQLSWGSSWPLVFPDRCHRQKLWRWGEKL